MTLHCAKLMVGLHRGLAFVNYIRGHMRLDRPGNHLAGASQAPGKRIEMADTVARRAFQKFLPRIIDTSSQRSMIALLLAILQFSSMVGCTLESVEWVEALPRNEAQLRCIALKRL